MAAEIDDVLPTATDLMKKLVEVEGEKASEYMAQQAKIEAEKKGLDGSIFRAIRGI